jgi:hypothetical protein
MTLAELLALSKTKTKANQAVQVVVSPKFHIDDNLKRASRVRFMFAVSGTERQGIDYVNATLSAPLEPDLVTHLTTRWDRLVHYTEYEPGDKYVGPEDASFLHGSLLQDVTRAALVCGKRAGASVVTLKAIVTPTR